MQSGLSLFLELLRTVRRQVLVDSRSGGYDHGPEGLSNYCVVRFRFIFPHTRSNSDVFLYLDGARVLELAGTTDSPVVQSVDLDNLSLNVGQTYSILSPFNHF